MYSIIMLVSSRKSPVKKEEQLQHTDRPAELYRLQVSTDLGISEYDSVKIPETPSTITTPFKEPFSLQPAIKELKNGT